MKTFRFLIVTIICLLQTSKSDGQTISKDMLNTLDKIVLTYDLPRPANPVDNGVFTLYSSQMVHVEPGFRKRKGMYSAIVFEVARDDNDKQSYFVQLIEKIGRLRWTSVVPYIK